MQHPEPPVTVQRAPWLRAATFLQGQHEPGRVLAPWSMGHAIDVIGERPVIVDNFGTMPDPITFERAYDAYLARREDALVQYCRASGARYVVIENPVSGLQLTATVLGIDSANYVRITGGMPPFVVTLGGLSVFRGLALMISASGPISGFEAPYRFWGQGRIATVPIPVRLSMVLSCE